MKYVIFCLVTILLTACSRLAASTPSSTQTGTVSFAATGIQAPINQTPTGITSSTPIPTATLGAYDFPAWMTDSSNILAALISDDFKKTRKISFFNAATGENYEISAPIDMNGFFWYDNMNFGILSKDLKTAYRISMRTGRVQTETISAKSTRLLEPGWVSALVVLNDHASGEVTFDRAWHSDVSKDKKFAAEWTDNHHTIVVTDTKTDQVVWKSTLAPDRLGTEIVWSPVEANHLAFLQGSLEPKSDLIVKSMVLTIVDVVEGKVLSSYEGNLGVLEWSPDGEMILYQDPSFLYRGYGIPFKDAPCILFLATGEEKCLRAIPHIIPAGYDLATTGVYEWANDSKFIYYTYVYYLQSNDEILGNLCRYSLADEHIECPTQDLGALHGRSIVYYDISPNQEFIHFCYSETTILNDVAGGGRDGIIGVDGSGFFSWVGAIQDGPPETCSFATLWRPLP
jgi:hypothetical protein